MILTHESGSHKNQFHEKKWRPKILWYYPFKATSVDVLILYAVFNVHVSPGIESGYIVFPSQK